MKRALTLGIGALALVGSAFTAAAADLGARPIGKAPMVAPPPPFSWTGCYIGGNIGGKRGELDGDATLLAVPPLFPLTTTLVFNNGDDETGLIGGGQVGCQWQTGAFVFGIEGDFDATDLERTFVVPAGLAIAPFVAGDVFTLSNDWQASLRGRLGWAFDRFMIYATGGVAWANFEATAALVGTPFIVSTDKTLTGWTVGGGGEWAFTPNWSLGVEYRFSQFDRENFGLGNLTVPGAVLPLAVNAELETHEITARVNYRFNLFGVR
jgi:outer membrane immunogenic protein